MFQALTSRLESQAKFLCACSHFIACGLRALPLKREHLQADTSTGGPQVNEVLKADWEANATPEQLAEAKNGGAAEGAGSGHALPPQGGNGGLSESAAPPPGVDYSMSKVLEYRTQFVGHKLYIIDVPFRIQNYEI